MPGGRTFWIGLRLAMILGAGGAWVLPAHATLFCDVKKTKDGFVALREKPDLTSKVLFKVPFGEDVQIDSTRAEKNGWAPVIYTGPRRGKMIPGWVRASLIVQECG